MAKLFDEHEITAQEVEAVEKLQDIASRHNLVYKHAHAFVYFIIKRFGIDKVNYDEHYVKEWAVRFRDGLHFVLGDKKSQDAIIEGYNSKDYQDIVVGDHCLTIP